VWEVVADGSSGYMPGSYFVVSEQQVVLQSGVEQEARAGG
jgi:hypothetical protein